jgi:hypothetical protein
MMFEGGSLLSWRRNPNVQWKPFGADSVLKKGVPENHGECRLRRL